MALIQSWRWYGPNDPVSLQDVKQAGATGIVSALHHIPHGAVWPLEEIQERKNIIESAGLKWVVVESVPVHEAIKTRSADCEVYLENYRQTLRNLAACGIGTVCYNFMPVLDWTRTNLALELWNGAKALYFDWADLAVFDMFILKRAGAEQDYAESVVQQAKERFSSMSQQQLDELSEIIRMGVPMEGFITLEHLTESIAIYKNIGHEGLRENLAYFLESIMDVCEETGINMTIHPDDPPYAILGLPRIASSKEDLLYIINRVDRPASGICFCTGSLGAGRHNDPVDILRAVGHRVYFAHLRNVQKDEEGNFYESDHLAGDVDMYGVMKELVAINQKREQPIPFRPDHGHQMLDDLHKETNPGYSAIGRLRGLAELRGLEMGIERSI
ncbi:mannonate dehydratase [Pontibacter akesuensis]|uniref:Mannonate dehydratase n=1 Tax=Pontibacter akesuensis TaxID=388950 RepID=A0A1I7JZ92_9BACT|nr:mannonate dehydratase [Pontibacter akesuensis]GHA76322.1 mannonate dehydratase [Pontibacter akesuensis]SFU90526.1 mannonate dehydratase [Pontibacter akesuensis]